MFVALVITTFFVLQSAIVSCGTHVPSKHIHMIIYLHVDSVKYYFDVHQTSAVYFVVHRVMLNGERSNVLRLDTLPYVL